MQTPKAWKVTASTGQDLEVAPCKVVEVELQVVGGRHSWTLGKQNRCCQEGKQMLQEEVAHPGSTLRWKKTGRRELKRPEKQYSASVQVNQKSQDNLHAGGPGSRAAVRPGEARHCASCEG